VAGEVPFLPVHPFFEVFLQADEIPVLLLGALFEGLHPLAEEEDRDEDPDAEDEEDEFHVQGGFYPGGEGITRRWFV